MNARPPAWVGPRGIAALAGLALVAGVFARVLPWPLVLGGAAVAALAAFAADARAIARGPAFTRAIPAHLMLARRAEFTYSVVNRAAVPLHFAIFEAPIERLEVGAAPARGSVPPAGRTVVRIGVLPRERGRTQAGLAFGWFESPLGLIRRRVRIGSVEALRIRPDLSALERGGDLALRSRLLDAGLRRVRRRGFGSEFESLREYAGGDAFRTIDWKATARRGKVMVAQYEVERSQQIVVALDAGRLMSARLGDRRKLDYAVSTALAIASFAQVAGDRVGLHAFAGTTLAALAPHSGARQTAALTDVLGDLEPHFEESDYERAALELRRRFRKRSLIVIFTDLFDPVASGAVLASLALLAPHHLVLVVLMNDAAIADALQREPATAGDVYRAGIATTLAAERDRAAAALRARGIGVIDVPARDLSLALLDAYVEVKTRSLL
ncbi:MAG: DUF58 domain-containing protein [Candidatus Velthaea sp.]|jgi:uncharacterized protein (DUF58 family)